MRSNYHGARHSSVHSAGRWLQVRRGLLPACWGTTGGQPGCACIAASGSELTATSCHCLTCCQRPQRPGGPQSVAEAPWKKKTVHHHSSLILTLMSLWCWSRWNPTDLWAPAMSSVLTPVRSADADPSRSPPPAQRYSRTVQFPCIMFKGGGN